MRNAVRWCVVGSIACTSTPSPAPLGPVRASPTVATVDAAPPPPTSPSPADSPPDVAPDLAPIDIKASAAAALAKLSPAQAKRAKVYGAQIGALATCTLDASGYPDKQCKSFQAIGDARDRQPNDEHWLDVQRAAWWMHADTRSASVRAYLIRGANPHDQDLAAVLIDAETDPKQLAYLLRWVRSFRSTPLLVKAVTARTAHPSHEVRLQALVALASIYPPIPPGVHATLVAAIDRDPSDHVRRETCRAAGGSRDDRMVAVYDRLLVPTTDAALFDACAEGLTTMWTDHPHGHEAAYRRTVKLLDAGRRDTPMRATWEALATYRRDRLEVYMKYAPWVNDTEVRTTLERRIVDRTANLVGRVGATMAFVQFGTEAHLKAVRAKLLASKGANEDPVVECINAALIKSTSCHAFFLDFAPK